MSATRAEAMAEARRLVVQEGATYAEASTATGIPLATLQKRAATEEWQGQRDSSMSYDAQMRAIKAALAAGLVSGASPGTS